MEFSAFALAIMIATNTVGQAINQEEVKDQSKTFEHWWGEKLEWRFDELPTKGSVSKKRMPYAGHIYPDRNGGTQSAMRKYDHAFYRGYSRATWFEQADLNNHREVRTIPRRYGWGRVRYTTVEHTPTWYGHCNGWTAAAIRHAEPKKNVIRNGVVFTPADIKGLLAELYMYSETEYLGGVNYVINPGTFHAVVTNWLGRKSHPIGMETHPGKEVWNFPMYGYAMSFGKRYGGREVEVKMNLGYKHYTNGEFHQAPDNRYIKYFHYMLTLDNKGEITGGYYLYNSSQVDMLWLPVAPFQGGKKGNERGNTYLNKDEVIAIWRDSVDDEDIEGWVNLEDARTEHLAKAEAERKPDEVAVEDVVEEGAEAIDPSEESGADAIINSASEAIAELEGASSTSPAAVPTDDSAVAPAESSAPADDLATEPAEALPVETSASEE